jgi:probable F420-dependent oxidoreductase
MKIGVMPSLGENNVNGKTPRWSEIREMAQAAEEAGCDSFWLADHLIYRRPDEEERGCWEAFTFLSAVAATTSRIALGPLVACASFRNPALLAKMADSLDEISGGRFILGLGAGWHQPEYDAFGYPFDHLASRFEEAVRIIVPLLHGERVDFHGRYYETHDTVLRPRGPSRSGPPIWIGASQPRMLRLVARYADAWNTVWHRWPNGVEAVYPKLLEACQDVGRDPATIELTAGSFATLLAPGEERAPDEKGIAGAPEEVARAIKGFADAGVKHLTLVLEPEDVTGIQRFGKVIEILDQMQA